MTYSNAQLYDRQGRRKYLNKKERYRFLSSVEKLHLEHKLFCLVLLYTGCRISEAIQLTKNRIDLNEKVIVFHSLKKRKRKSNVIYQRAVPVPPFLIKDLHKFSQNKSEAIWSFSRTTGWRIVREVMESSDIHGTQACPKGLRHGFGITCSENNVPLSMISIWMGHSNIKTTMIYLDAVGIEEREFMSRTWNLGKKSI